MGTNTLPGIQTQTAFLVPAYNEQEVIARTLQSLLQITSAEHIFVVDDGSKDDTVRIAKQYTANVLAQETNRGKANALSSGIIHFTLTERFTYIMPLDADTRLDPDFLKYVGPHFANEKIVAVVGKVQGSPYNWLTTYRLWEYEIAQAVHKHAQSKLGVVLVCSGPATIYRSIVFTQLSIPTDTMAEDMDTTFSIHRLRLGAITYAPNAIAFTQDPKQLKDFIKQVRRWDIGFWQCVYKHNIPWQGQLFDAEVGLLALEGLFNGFLIVLLTLLLPIIFLSRPGIILLPMGIDFFLFLLPTVLYTAIKNRLVKIFLYLPLFYGMRVLTSILFLETFLRVVLTLDSRYGWNKVRRYTPTNK
jgi:poly-beta-1,6-N-acetyl-D-glucosamine synthase